MQLSAHRILHVILAAGLALLAGPALAQSSFEVLEKGLELGIFDSGRKTVVGDGKIHVLRVDPKLHDLVLLNASAPGEGRALSPSEWTRRHELLAVINASMYAKDYRTSISLMRTGTHVNNPKLSKDKTILAFDPVSKDDPPVMLIDRECDDFETLSKRYRSFVQSIRMISCKGANVWSQQPKIWSQAAIALDDQGRVLMIHSRSPHSTHDFIEVLKALPLGIARAMYLEGGAPAQLYIKAGGKELSFIGSYATGSREDDSNILSYNLPNVIGVRRRR